MFGTAQNTTGGFSFGQKPSMFGQQQPQQQPQQQQQTGMFGQQQQQPQPSLFGVHPTQEQQQPHLPLQQQQQPPLQQQQPLQESRFSKYKLKNNLSSTESEWASNGAILTSTTAGGLKNGPQLKQASSQIKRRVLPTHLIKRTNKSSDPSSEDSESSSLQNLPFQNNLQKRNPGLDNIDDDDMMLDDIYKDTPPMRSMFDFNTSNDNEASNSLAITNVNFRKFESNPDDFKNVFNRYQRNKVEITADLNNTNMNLPFTASRFNGQGSVTSTTAASGNTIKKDSKDKEPTTLDSAVLIFGYDDSNFTLMVEHFSKFGTVLENFNQETKPTFSYQSSPYHTSYLNQKYQSTDSNKIPLQITKNYPIFIGLRWMKLTYDNPSSAIRALRENNSTDDKGNVVGVIPYSKKNLEKLLKFEIPDSQDIGSSISMIKLSSQELYVNNEMGRLFGNGSVGNEDHANSIDAEFKLKDGSNLINIPKSHKKTEKAGFIDSSIKFIFGKGEL